MRSRRTLIAGIFIWGTLMVAACSGPPGPQGPPGPAGPAGPEGPQGAPAESAIAQQVAEAESAGAAPAVPSYVGSEICSGCHLDIYNAFIQTGHAWLLNPVQAGEPPLFPFTSISRPPAGYTWNDVLYVVGGYNHRAIFLNKDGYLITDLPGSAGDSEYLNQFNFENPFLGINAGWVGFHAGEENVPYDCGICHTTGYNPLGNQDGLAGMIGTWMLPGVQCEECHGAGSLHIQNPEGFEMKVSRDREECERCHRSYESNLVSIADGFIPHQDYYEDLYQSKHIILDCVDCHNPHTGVIPLQKSGEQTIKTPCENCHFDQARYQNNEKHLSQGVTCVQCHMPRLIKSAWGIPQRFSGDIRTHVVAIDATRIKQTSEDGSTAHPHISLDFACRQCHLANTSIAMDDQDLIDAASGYHESAPPISE